MTTTDQQFMARAIQLARQGWYTTMPNPRVGCVIVQNGEILAEGAHLFAGEGHAEVNALALAGERAKGATVYVTLEPCSHHGRTPPCSQALIDAGIARVVAGMQDPNPLVAGKGLAQCRQAGIEVSNGIMLPEVEALNPGYSMRMREGRPRVTCKLAMSLDGRTAMASGESKWITSAEARRDVHLLRAASGAVLTGIGTVQHDDPQLDIRLEPVAVEHPLYNELTRAGQRRQALLRLVVDSKLDISFNARILASPESSCIFTAAAPEQAAPLQEQGIELVCAPGAEGRVDLQAVMAHLAARGINDVLVEAGATLVGSLLAAQLVDELVIYMAPLLMGDMARGLAHIPGLEKMADKVELTISDIRAIGRDWRITARPVYI
jgi:diaminohydroxyphosphoribosylaminopyrimidine deaminase/5-amino-6-(5-phosphoribosylamino)uracil reductase